MTKEELEKEARKYLAEHSEYSEVFGETFVAVDTLTAMVDFAEPREKRIAELETRCNELFLQTCEQTEKIKELKEYNKYLRRKRQGGIQKQYNKVAIIKQQDDQLTKAKEIISEFVEWANWQSGGNCPSFKSIQDKAEQFLKEE